MKLAISLGMVRQAYVTASGTSFSWPAPTQVKLMGDGRSVMTSDEWSWVVAVIEIGVLLSPMPAGLAADHWGRRPVALITGPLYIASWLLILQVQTVLALMVARVMQGVAIGVAFTVMPMYLGEIAAKDIRGAVTSSGQIAVYLGYLFEFFIGPFVSYETLATVSTLLPAAFFLTFVWQPESPHYYVLRGREEEAQRVLMWLRGSTVADVQEELEETITSVKEATENKASWRDLISSPTDRRAFLILQVVFAVKLLSGLPAIVSYSTTLFKETGFTAVSPAVMSMVLGVVLFVSGFFSTALTDHVGRRPLLIVSCVGCAVSLSTVSLVLYLSLSHVSWVTPSAILLYCLFFAFGLDPVTMTLRAEMFAPNTRAVASSLTTINFTVSAFITFKLYQVISEAARLYLVFLVFSLVAWIGSLWVYLFTIETKDKSLPQIQRELQENTWLC